MIQEKSGILEREKNEFAAAQKEKQDSRPEHPKGEDDEQDERTVLED
jgi:hypothetical protein